MGRRRGAPLARRTQAGAEKFEKTIIYSFSLENLSQTTQTTFKHCKESSWSDERGGVAPLRAITIRLDKYCRSDVWQYQGQRSKV